MQCISVLDMCKDYNLGNYTLSIIYFSITLDKLGQNSWYRNNDTPRDHFLSWSGKQASNFIEIMYTELCFGHCDI